MNKKYNSTVHLWEEYKLTKEKLLEAKKQKITVIACDYDGTLFDRADAQYNNLAEIIKLASQVTNAGIEFAFVSGRNTTLQVGLRELIPQYCQNQKKDLRVWYSGGNGMNLQKIYYTYAKDRLDIQKIFNNSLSNDELNTIVDVYDNLNINPDKKSQCFFQLFLEKELPEDLIPKKLCALSRQYQGKIFAETVKVTLVLPTPVQEQKKYIKKLRNKLTPFGLNVGWGGIPFADISKEIRDGISIVDGKYFMVKKMIEALKITDHNVVTFGDTPNDNNQGLLQFPYSFTNDKLVLKRNLTSPPYVLEFQNSPIKAVYDAIQFLIQ